MNESFKIVWIMPNRLGDIIFHTPAVRYIYQDIPTIQIDIIAFTDLSAEVFKFNPYINEIITRPSDKKLQSLPGEDNRVICSNQNKLGYSKEPRPSAGRGIKKRVYALGIPRSD